MPYPSIMPSMYIDPAYSNLDYPNSHDFMILKFNNESKTSDIFFLGALNISGHIFLNKEDNKYILKGIYNRNISKKQINLKWLICKGKMSDLRKIFYLYTKKINKRIRKKRRQPVKKPKFWYSWYTYYEKISANEIRENLKYNDYDQPLYDYMVIDDGWQIKTGDWEPNDKFSDGMKNISDDIKNTKMKSGLWIAPLIAVESSNIFNMKKEMFLTNPNGEFILAG